MNKNSNPDLKMRLAAAAPYLVALRDHQNITKAAAQFGLHQTALSHRLRGLEDALGHTLFTRTTRALSLTSTGEIVCAAAEATVAEWDRALELIDRRHAAGKIVLSLPSSLAMKWIVPVLPGAKAAGLDLSLEVQDDLVPPGAGGPDAAIRFGIGPYPGLHTAHLAHCDMWPVVRPGTEPEGLPCLRDRRGEKDGTGFDWAAYFKELGQRVASLQDAPSFDRADLMLQAAMAGLGVGLGRTLLVENDVRDGFLEIAGPPVRIRAKYHLVTTTEFAGTDSYNRLMDWLRAEVAAARAATAV